MAFSIDHRAAALVAADENHSSLRRWWRHSWSLRFWGRISTFGARSSSRNSQAFVRGAAGTTALALDGEAINTIRSPHDATSPAFQAARKILDQSRRINGLAENEMYILAPIGASPFETEFVVMLQKKTFIGNHYSVPVGNWERFLDAWNTGQPTSSDIYEDEKRPLDQRLCADLITPARPSR